MIFSPDNPIPLLNFLGLKPLQESKKVNIEETYEHSKKCMNIRSCKKRHPKVGKFYSMENVCRFGAD